MFTIDLSNGTKLTASVELTPKPALRVQQVATVSGGNPPTGAISIPLADLKRLSETVGGIVKAFRS